MVVFIDHLTVYDGGVGERGVPQLTCGVDR
jgi:hypothetical protein